MIQRTIGALLLSLLLGVIGCAANKSPKASAPMGEPKTFETTKTGDRLEPGTSPDANSPADSAPNLDEKFVSQEPMLATGEKKNSLSTYEIPESVRARLLEEIPTLPQPSKAFSIQAPHLFISAKTSTMTFTGTLKVQGRKDERLELRCAFDRAQLWNCGGMFPTDEKIAKEKRLQATVNCLDTDRCDQVGLKIFVLIDGKVESQLFQTETFSIQQAESGDLIDGEEGHDGHDHGPQPAKPQEQLPTAPSKKFQGQLPRESQDGGGGIAIDKQTQTPGQTPGPTTPPRDPNQPTPGQLPPGVESYESITKVDRPALTQKEIDDLLEDPNAAVEIAPPVWTPAPEKSEYSIPGIEKMTTKTGKGVRSQAFGNHNKGFLRNGVQMKSSGPGFIVRKNNRSYGTDIMMQMLEGASAAVEKRHPKAPPFVMASISNKTGGALLNRSGRPHASHQNGLDVDVVFPASRKVDDMWNVCTLKGGSCGRGARIDSDFDTQRFWEFAKSMTCAEGNPVRVMFLDAQIKQHLCEYVKKHKSEEFNDPKSCAHRTLKAMKHSVGHHNHVHIRLRCPGNGECQERTFDLGRGTGC